MTPLDNTYRPIDLLRSDDIYYHPYVLLIFILSPHSDNQRSSQWLGSLAF